MLLDVFGADRMFGPNPANALRACIAEGQVVACEAVWTEVATVFSSPARALEAMKNLSIEFNAVRQETALTAASAWKVYRSRGGRRERVVADFLIGAHVQLQAERLLTCDRGFYRGYFRGLRVLDPSKG